jgi:hypothetical protein
MPRPQGQWSSSRAPWAGRVCLRWCERSQIGSCRSGEALSTVQWGAWSFSTCKRLSVCLSAVQWGALSCSPCKRLSGGRRLAATARSTTCASARPRAAARPCPTRCQSSKASPGGRHLQFAHQGLSGRGRGQLWFRCLFWRGALSWDPRSVW